MSSLCTSELWKGRNKCFIYPSLSQTNWQALYTCSKQILTTCCQILRSVLCLSVPAQPTLGLGPLSAHPGDISPCLCDSAGVLGSSSSSGPTWMLPALQAACLGMDSLHMCHLQPSLVSSAPGQSPWPWLITAVPEAADRSVTTARFKDCGAAPHGWGHRLHQCHSWGWTVLLHHTLTPCSSKGSEIQNNYSPMSTCSFPMGENFSDFNTINSLRRLAASPLKCIDCKQFYIYRNNKML